MNEACSCGNTNAHWVADPFIEEIYDSIEMRWLCDDCYHELCMEI